jgi:hypothetical protein
VLPALSFFDPPADAPAALKIAGKFTAPDGKRVDAAETIMGTSFLSAAAAPRPTGIKLPFKGQPLQGLSASSRSATAPTGSCSTTASAPKPIRPTRC